MPDKETYSYPHEKNFCGGNFQDWLEVNLTPTCNGNCKWCVEKIGWQPKKHAPWIQHLSTHAIEHLVA